MIDYNSDLSDSQYELIKESFHWQRKRKIDLHVVVNGIFYLVKNGCVWRDIPHQELVSWQTIYYYFREWKRKGIWQKILDRLREQERESAGRISSPSAAILDSQSVKGSRTGESRGYDGGKKTKGRKRHILVDTMGLVMAVFVSAANISDQAGANALFDRIRGKFPRLKRIFADGTYRGKEWHQKVAQAFGWIIDVLLRNEQLKAFLPEPIRWKVERTIGWFEYARRLSKSYEYLPESEEAMVIIAHIRLLIRRKENKNQKMFQYSKCAA